MRAHILVIVLALASLLLPAYAYAQTTPKKAPTPTAAKSQASGPDAKQAVKPKAKSKKVKAARSPSPGATKTSLTVSKSPKKSLGKSAKKPIRAGQRIPPAMRSPSISGPIGLDRVWSADTGPEGTFRTRFSLSWFDAADFPIQGSSNTFLGSDIALAYTPHKWVEAFLSFRGTSNTNEGARPALINTQGDMTIGAKAGAALAPNYSMAGAIGMRLLSGVGGAGFEGAATSVDLRWLNTLDFKKTGEAPVRAHFDIGYYLENSEAIYADENGEPSIIEEFGLQIGRYDRLTVALGLEFPIQPDIDPYLEYSLTLPILVELARRGEGSGDYGFNSVPHSLTAGIRSYPLPELAFDLAIRYGLADAPYTGVPSTPPWTVVVGAAYTLDPRPQVIERVVKSDVAAPPKPAAKVAGTEMKGRVMAVGGKKPLVGATISYPGQQGSSAQLTDLQGRFSGYRFAPGKIVVQAEAKGYLKAKTTVELKADKAGVANFELKPDPAAQDGRLEVRVFDDRGRAMNARVSLGGDASGTAGLSTPKKPFSAKVKAGRYPMTVSAKGFQDSKRNIQVKGADTANLRITLSRPISKRNAPISSSPAPRTGSSSGAVSRGKWAVVTSRGIKLNKKVSFEKGSARLTASGKQVLDDVARGMKRIKSIKKVRIGAHASTPASRAANMKLSNDRARAVMKYLAAAGVAANRLQPRGFGADKPIGPNITARGRARNNRINFLVLGR